ncbi:fibrillin-2-like isoform X2 [Xenia sp. Carnegie-2017]|uniref:fibrillin-2-like isoform X2 n=1 Tax=Xenia sp. Carnegie-2017 TaxID=2897299 RepID=UPI001F039D75|nr:fibrillin-2-like isoform X2 [Xenia sp. Carnegie-2017]
MVCAKVLRLFILLILSVSVIPAISTKKAHRIRRSGPNVCGSQCCSGWQSAQRGRSGQGLCILPICNVNCGTGICVSPNLCLCEDGQTASQCTQTATCDKPCLNGGECIRPNTCACPPGFAGPECQSDLRQGPCFKEIKDSKCSGQITTLLCTKEMCCATVGKAWGQPCEACPDKPAPCAIGYVPNFATRECLDIDECKAVPGVCPANVKCINTVGSYRCGKCASGFTFNDQLKRCVKPTVTPAVRKDLCFRQILSDNCILPLSNNLTKSSCCCGEVAGAGWSSNCLTCPLQDSSEYDTLCGNLGECSFEGDVCGGNIGECRTTESGLTCVCAIGYNYDPDQKLCVDVDECDGGGLICTNALCYNTPGSFRCDCKLGFVPDPFDRLRCTRTSVRISTPPLGLTNPDSPTPSPPVSSTPSGVCSRVGQRCDNGECVRVDGVIKCRCVSGFNDTTGKCEDVDECQEDSNVCENGMCINEIGGYRCQCAAGYITSSDKKSCVDRNECEESSKCSNGRCINTKGAWRCTCNQGFTLSDDKKSCIDNDECTTIADVCMNGRCINTAGDYECRCNTGYTTSTDKHMCLDTMVSMCYAKYDNNVCSQALFRSLTISQCCCGKDNTGESRRAWGSPCMACPVPDTDEYTKVCVNGAGKDSGGKDVDECSNNVGSQTVLCENGQCRNTNGDYSCDCNVGYRRTTDSKTCNEINECRENPSLCNRGRCENSPGSYRCVCPAGFVFDSRTRGCEDVNECSNKGQCVDGTCVNTIGSFLCRCPQGFTLDSNGRYCRDLRKGKCWRFISDTNVCEDNVNGDVTREVCCQTLGKGWGSPCQKCDTIGKRCRSGFLYDNFTCVDIDECQAFPGICRNGRCLNTPGSYQCVCSEGLTLDESKSVCLDLRDGVCYQAVTRDQCTQPVSGLYKKDICCCSVGAAWGRPCQECPLRNSREFNELCRQTTLTVFDECTVFPDICINGECIDTSGSFLCECRSGFALDQTGKNCTDINECQITPDLCGNGTCINTAGGFRCNCREGFKNAPMMMEVCIDVNECDDLPNPCQGGTCVNTIGSFKCECPTGKRMDSSGLMCQDINECAENSFICPNGNCQNFMGGYQCACFPGFVSSDDMKSCIDVNECETENGQCEATCENTIGSYRCSCPPGMRLRLDERTCGDIDECVETPNICGIGNKCQNVHAGHECICSDAYALSEDRKSCIDIDECITDPNLCRNGQCQNLLGSYQCICPRGFFIDETTSVAVCSDVNECESDEINDCGRNSFCMNTIGSYSCSCLNGFRKIANICRDVDECRESELRNICGNNSQCRNTDGSYSCECRQGYFLASDGACKDVDECRILDNVCANGKCLNLPGSYQCDCDFGYLQTFNEKGCEDLDECEVMKEFCHHGRCENIPGSFQCICDKGFQLNRYNNNCTDTNECQESGMCLNGRCVNEMGKYRCECDEDFVPNPTNTACIDTRKGNCHLVKDSETDSCSYLITDSVLRSICCCSVGTTWNDCEECPKNGTDEYRHLCPSVGGYIVDPNTTSLIDIDECKFPRICVDGTCTNTLGSFMCTCSKGFEYNHEIGVCEDINECEIDRFICGFTGVCINNEGSYECQCPPGEAMIGTVCIDERPQLCFGDKQDLSNVESLFPGPSCNESITYRPITRTECCCSKGTAYGPPDMCKLCPLPLTDEYYALCAIVRPTPTPIRGIGGTAFPPGGTPGVIPITDVDECSFLRNPCGMGTCRNTYASYECDCEKGFAVKNGNPRCEDQNECLLNPCFGGECKNTFGSFMCSCEVGYVVDETGVNCVDHNECHLNDTCVNGNCINEDGGYRCECDQGYQPIRTGKACADVDECFNGISKCQNGTCVNTPGSYSCQCDEGFREDSRHACQDIDECAESGTQICRNGVCKNEFGGFTCLCNVGYVLNATEKHCRDRNECLEIENFCLNGTCTNTLGGSICECRDGFSLNPSGDSCIDINECDDDPNLCQMDGNCVNTAGSFECVCPVGYEVANYGKMCVDMRKGYCFNDYDDRGCSNPRMILSTKQVCCCTRGAGWGDPCDICPVEQTEAFSLLCSKGHGYAVKNNTVDDVNECEYDRLCANGRCVNNDGSFRCECFAGYQLDEFGRNCEDIDECAKPGICGNGTCNNQLGSYSCDCASGFKRGRFSPTCEDIDECSETRNLCAFRCVNNAGSYQCICPRGYKLHTNKRHCIDVDECKTGTHNCRYVCKNFHGGFKCICPEGFRRSAGGSCIDINECREGSSRCRDGNCRNTPGSYICDCNEGYKRTSDGRSCEDLTRGLCFAQVDNGLCKASTKIMILVTKSDCCCTAGIAWGSQCTICPRKNTVEHRRLCVPFQKTMDECKMIFGLCPNGKCINTADSYRCMCHQGYKLRRDGKSCVDINECHRIPKPCRTECINTPGSYRCKCPSGYEEISGRCQDINECRNSSVCPQQCVNTLGSYRCSCRQGYQWQGTSCVDINECDRRNVCRFGSCVNQDGSYTCLCRHGYRYNSQTKTCVDLNECNVRSCQGTCVNINGGYRCGCPSGFVRQLYWNQCIDVNECTTGANKCGRTKCFNIQGGYRCYCPRGYLLDQSSMTCIDKNECVRNPCSTAGCHNIRGGFQCSCPTGFYAVGGGHCIARYAQQRLKGVVTQNKYKFGEKPKTQREVTPSRYYKDTSQTPFKSQWGYRRTQTRYTKSDPYRYTYSYSSSSSGRRRRRASHFVHKLNIDIQQNATALQNLLVLTPVLESLQKKFHYEIVRGNRSLFAVKIENGLSFVFAKKTLRVGRYRLYLKGKLRNAGMSSVFASQSHIDFDGKGDVKEKVINSQRSEISLNEINGLSEARKFHLLIAINVQ